MRLVGLRRYPVKSLGGESLDTVAVDPRGVTGDRWYAVVDGDGRLAAAKDSRRFRRRDAVFDYAARTTPAGVVVAGRGEEWAVGQPSLDEALSAACAADVSVRAEDLTPHFDAGAVSLVGTASLEWVAAELGVDADPRRLRVNLVVETDVPFVEEGWVGSQLRIGSAAFAVTERVERCRTVDLAQDGVATPARLLTALGRTRDACLAVYLDVVTPGVVSVGDPLVLAAR